VEKGLGADTYCVAGSTEKRILKKKENDYKCATDLMLAAEKEKNYENYFSAAKIFVSLADFQDAEEKASGCKQLGEKLKAEIEVERARQEAERKAAEEKRLAEIKAHNDKINTQIAEADKALAIQKAIYAQNAGKIFGAGAKLKKTAKAEIARLESEVANLRRNLK
jgi:hypothetical protein